MIGGDKIWANTNELTGKPYTIYSLEEFVAIGTAWDPIKELRFDAATKTTGQTSTTNLRKRLLNEPVRKNPGSPNIRH
jgi:hypothetical protein